MKHSMRRGGLAVAVLALAAFVALPAVASAGLKTRVSTVSIPDASPVNGSAVATCPSRHTLVWGGFQGAFTSTDSGIYPTEAVRISKRSWRVSGWNSTGSGNANNLSAFAYCFKGKIKFKTAQTTVTVPANADNVTATAFCPGGTRAWSGGFRISTTYPSADFVVINGSYRGSKGSWVARASEVSGVPGTLTAYAYCVRSSKVKSDSNTASPPIAQASIRTLIADCSGGGRDTTGGGFLADNNSLLQEIEPIQLIRESRGAVQGRYDGAGPTPGSATTFAYCI